MVNLAIIMNNPVESAFDSVATVMCSKAHGCLAAAFLHAYATYGDSMGVRTYAHPGCLSRQGGRKWLL